MCYNAAMSDPFDLSGAAPDPNPDPNPEPGAVPGAASPPQSGAAEAAAPFLDALTAHQREAAEALDGQGRVPAAAGPGRSRGAPTAPGGSGRSTK